jgi:hypothetical protein
MPNREDVVAAALATFPRIEAATVLSILDLYGTHPGERERERVQLAVLVLSQGSEDKLLSLVQIAKIDYRDVLSWVETGPLPEPEGEQLRRSANQLLERWGKK